MRSAFDKLISGAGLALAVTLLAAGGLLTWGHYFVAGQVHDQLVMQDITMPAGEALAGLPAADAKILQQYAGSKLDSGPEARAYADHYILIHMNEMADGQTYSQVSGQFVSMTDEQKASAEGQALGGLRQSLFMGDTLRGLLLYGYAFATIGTIAGIAALVSFGAAAVLLLLVGLGFRHSRRTEATEGRFVGGRVPVPA
ncbi:MAG: hypothetical protein NTV23_07575 [Propionibacteriales bacterium]|nr:hypothetical protein [Propionibacteriales bacterium]